MSEHEIDLSEFDAAYDAAVVSDDKSLPDGNYQCRIDKVRLGTTKSGIPMLSFDLVVISGAFTGRHLFKNSVFTAGSIEYIKKDLVLLGLKLNKLSDLNANLEKLLDLNVQVCQKMGKNSEYPNVYFNSLLNIANQPTEDAPF